MATNEEIEKLLRDSDLPLPSPHGSAYFNEYLARYKKFAESYAQHYERELVIDCKTCANRGVVNGNSQETFCEHCIHSTPWKRNYYKPLSAAPKE